MDFTKISFGDKFIYIIVLVTTLIYGLSLSNDYNIDDSLYVNNDLDGKGFFQSIELIFTTPSFTEQDGVVHEYRPASKLFFYLEKTIFGKNPFISHAINLVLYLFLLWMIWKFLYTKIGEKCKPFFLISVLLFAVHPIHTEVVCNIKAREELLVSIFGIASLYLLYKYCKQSKVNHLILMMLFFFLSMMSKKNGVLFLPLLAFFHFIWNKKYWSKQTLIVYFGLCLTVVVFFVLHDTLESSERVLLIYENPLIGAKVTFLEKIATGFYCIGRYCVLLVYPHPLSSYYGYLVIPVVTFNSILAWFGVFIIAGVTLFGLYNLKNKKPFGALALGFVVILLAISNLVEPIPGLVAERLAFIPSLVFIPFLVLLLFKIGNWLKFPKTVIYVAFLVIGLSYSILSFQRTFDWKNNIALFKKDLSAYPENLKLWVELGNVYFRESENPLLTFNEKQDKLLQARRYYTKALLLAPNKDLTISIAEIDCMTGNEKNCNEGINNTVLKKPFAKYNQFLLDYYLQKGDTLKAISSLELLLKENPQNLKGYETLNRMYFKTQQNQKGILLLEKLIQKFPKSPLGYAEMANFYLTEKDTLKALPFIEKAALKSPKNPAVITFLISYYSKKKNTEKVNKYSNLLNISF
jgi:hypothetical protein